MARNGDQIARLLRLITMIHGDRRWRPAMIAEHMQRSERSVYRDLDRLKSGGVPVDYDKAAGGYYIKSGFGLKTPYMMRADAGRWDGRARFRLSAAAIPSKRRAPLPGSGTSVLE